MRVVCASLVYCCLFGDAKLVVPTRRQFTKQTTKVMDAAIMAAGAGGAVRSLTALEARRCSNFCTISAKGVTSEREGEMEFIPLDPWLDEAARFTELTSMRFFIQFRRWKAYQRLH